MRATFVQRITRLFFFERSVRRKHGGIVVRDARAIDIANVDHFDLGFTIIMLRAFDLRQHSQNLRGLSEVLHRPSQRGAGNCSIISAERDSDHRRAAQNKARDGGEKIHRRVLLFTGVCVPLAYSS
jgi:hypothetical protein